MERFVKTLIRRSFHPSIILILVAGFSWLFLGVLEIDGETEVDHEIFIKKIPTFQVVFNNPYLSVPTGEENSYSKRRDKNGEWLPDTKESKDYLQYCKYRYGVSGNGWDQVKAKCSKGGDFF